MTTRASLCCDAPKELTTAQTVFDCDDLKKEIFSYCLPQYPIITKKMIDKRLAQYRQIHNWQRRQPVWYPHWQGSWWRTMREIRALPDDWWKVLPGNCDILRLKHYIKYGVTKDI